MSPTVSFTAYHGTLPSRIEAITKRGFQPSLNVDDWLGLGSYFFVDGLSDPWMSAMDWAVCSSWDKTSQRFRECSVAVVKVLVTAPQDSVFDLRDMANATQFHLYRRNWLNRIHSTKLTDIVRPQERTYDAQILNDFRDEHQKSILIGNFHIQLSVRERYMRIDSRVPNVSVLCMASQSDATQCSISDVTIVEEPEWSIYNRL